MSTTHTGLIAVLFGPPGSGKGTQAAFIAEAFHLAHISTGDMLRAEAATGSPLGQELAAVMSSGELVSDDLIVRIVEAHLGVGEEGAAGVLLDGFPRTIGQAVALDAMLRRTGRRIDVVLFLDVPEEEVRERILRRAASEDRADDTPETVHTRLEVYERDTAPVLVHYETTGTNVQRVDGVGEVEAVRARIRDAFAGANGGTVVA